MRFQILEIVDTPNDEKVLDALESSLQYVSTKITRKRGQITVHGLGHSSQSMNPQDIAVIFVDVENDQTIIKAYVMFEESALLTEAAQSGIVRSKLDQALRNMTEMLDEEILKSTELDAIESSVSDALVPEVDVIELGGIGAFSEIETSQAPILIGYQTLASSYEPEKDHPEKQVPKNSAYNRLGALLTAIAALVLMSIGSYIYGYHHREFSPNIVGIKTRPQEIEQRSAVRTESQVATPSEFLTQPIASISDPYELLQEWVAAMRTRDTVAQASFYSYPIDMYLGQFNVSREILFMAKQTAIADRKGLWTIKLEKILIERPLRSEATVRLVKHFIEQPDRAKISERFVRAQLTLKMLSGQWKITSEQDFPSQ
jgi:hypothetical protein